MTLGELIESGYRTCGKGRARGIIRLAAKARLIVFQENTARLRFPTRVTFFSQGKLGDRACRAPAAAGFSYARPDFGGTDPATEPAWSQGPLQ